MVLQVEIELTRFNCDIIHEEEFCHNNVIFSAHSIAEDEAVYMSLVKRNEQGQKEQLEGTLLIFHHQSSKERNVVLDFVSGREVNEATGVTQYSGYWQSRKHLQFSTKDDNIPFTTIKLFGRLNNEQIDISFNVQMHRLYPSDLSLRPYQPYDSPQR